MNLKPCPFCGHPVRLTEMIEHLTYGITKAKCLGCRMEFEYCQDFTLSRKDRVAKNEPFETAWNRRAEDA